MSFEMPIPLGRMPERFELLTLYNGQCARGVSHGGHVDAAMAELQHDFNEWRKIRFIVEHSDCTVIETGEGGLVSIPQDVEISDDAPADWKVIYQP